MEETIGTLFVLLPLLLILWLANMADRQRGRGQQGNGWALVSYGLLSMVYALLILFGLIFQAIGLLVSGPMGAELNRTYAQMGIEIASFSLLGLGTWLPSLAGIVLLLPPVRRLAARWIPIRADSAVHAVALSFSMLVLVNLAVTVGLGIRNLASALETSAGSEAFNPAPALWVQQLAFVAMALVGVGWLSRRSLVEALKRLGVVWPGLVQAVSGLGAGVGLALAVLVLEYLVSKAGVSTDAAVEKLTEQLLGPLTKSVSGILTLGIAAGLGEESLFRGALQPRFGLFLTALLFSLLHSTYGLTLSTLFVFLVGLALGLIRTRANTSTTMIVHAIYNMTLGVIAYLGVMQGV